jgi:hypothetical protein
LCVNNVRGLGPEGPHLPYVDPGLGSTLGSTSPEPRWCRGLPVEPVARFTAGMVADRNASPGRARRPAHGLARRSGPQRCADVLASSAVGGQSRCRDIEEWARMTDAGMDRTRTRGFISTGAGPNTRPGWSGDGEAEPHDDDTRIVMVPARAFATSSPGLRAGGPSSSRRG